MIFNNSTPFSESARTWWRIGCFFALSLFSITLEALPIWRNLGFSLRFFPLILFFCSVYYDGALTYGGLVLLGVFADSLWQAPVGFTSLNYLFLYALLQTQAHYFQQSGIIFGWLGFSIFCVLDFAITETLNFLVTGVFLLPTRLILSHIFIVLFYPLGFAFLRKFSKKIG
jgi:hypothetical protein